MDIIYNIEQIGTNRILFNETRGNTSVTFSVRLTNPWTQEQKTATLIADGDDGEWIINFEGSSGAYEDLAAGLIEFENLGTWSADINFGGTIVRIIRLQVV